jgi:hypothetical protein
MHIETTTDLKSQFLEERFLPAFEAFETSLEHEFKASGVSRVPNGGAINSCQMSYQLDTGKSPIELRIRFVGGGPDSSIHHTFIPEVEGNGILKMKIVWCDENHRFDSTELGAYCANELLTLSQL